MAGLSDMEELVGSVPEKDIANYLREAFACYGTGAYRACVVLTHIALFEGLRQKLHALATVNAAAKAVLDVIEPLASSQKPFESSLIASLKSNGVIDELEANILEQLNKQRNKAAHPSGHHVTAEEARYVFSEAIKKFLSKPIRQTSIVVDGIMARIGEANFFPTIYLNENTAVVDQETAQLDSLGLPHLVAKLAEKFESKEVQTVRNVRTFILALTARNDSDCRQILIKRFITPKATNTANAEVFSEIIGIDPLIIKSCDTATTQRLSNLLVQHTKTHGTSKPLSELRHPAHVLASCLKRLGEDYVIENLDDFRKTVIANCPVAPGFVASLKGAPKTFAALFDNYCTKLASSQFATSNPMAEALPQLDEALASLCTPSDAIRLISAVMQGAKYGGFRSGDLVNAKFEALPKIKKMTLELIDANAEEAQKALEKHNPLTSLKMFKDKLEDTEAQEDTEAE